MKDHKPRAIAVDTKGRQVTRLSDAGRITGWYMSNPPRHTEKSKRNGKHK